ncbi:hypothetical protein B0T24DRAFT_711521 [Lasiosphaeria ovina]|uniref:Uncharacterized protein n=1 Tax=Lasiosphaeria ovina TaxID=92902 RepID=A0AAE0JXD8_9PEZI|nr:hypothetical protein B0T24DRAFT_711521 [Lasiosphaeria ovina]
MNGPDRGFIKKPESMSIQENTSIIGVCGVSTIGDAAPHEGGGPFISDSFAFKHLLAGLGSRQTWFLGISPETLVEEHGEYLNGSSCRQRKAVLSREMIDKRSQGLENLEVVGPADVLLRFLGIPPGEYSFKSRWGRLETREPSDPGCSSPAGPSHIEPTMLHNIGASRQGSSTPHPRSGSKATPIPLLGLVRRDAEVQLKHVSEMVWNAGWGYNERGKLRRFLQNASPTLDEAERIRRRLEFRKLCQRLADELLVHVGATFTPHLQVLLGVQPGAVARRPWRPAHDSVSCYLQGLFRRSFSAFTPGRG